MYPSDFVYTFAYGVDNTCYSRGDSCGYGSGNPRSSWFFYADIGWTMSPTTSDSDDVFVILINESSSGLDDFGKVSSRSTGTGNQSRIRPCVYLHSSVKIISGDGSKNNSYKIG